MDEELLFLGGLILLVLLVVGYPLTLAVSESRATHKCLEAGWPSASVTWNYQKYCIARTDQTDIVKPLEWAVTHPR